MAEIGDFVMLVDEELMIPQPKFGFRVGFISSPIDLENIIPSQRYSVLYPFSEKNIPMISKDKYLVRFINWFQVYHDDIQFEIYKPPIILQTKIAFNTEDKIKPIDDLKERIETNQQELGDIIMLYNPKLIVGGFLNHMDKDIIRLGTMRDKQSLLFNTSPYFDLTQFEGYKNFGKPKEIYNKYDQD